MTWHDTTSHHHMTWHIANNQITSPHVTSQPTTLLHLTPEPTTWHHVPHHRTLHHHRHTVETQPATTATTKTPPPDGMAEGWCAEQTSNWASRWLVSLRIFYKQILSLVYNLFPPESSAPSSPGHSENTRHESTSMWAGLAKGARKSSQESMENLRGEWMRHVSTGWEKFPTCFGKWILDDFRCFLRYQISDVFKVSWNALKHHLLCRLEHFGSKELLLGGTFGCFEGGVHWRFTCDAFLSCTHLRNRKQHKAQRLNFKESMDNASGKRSD